MHWPSSRLLSLKGSKKPETERESEFVYTKERAATPCVSYHEKWHREVKNSRQLLKYLETGSPSVGSTLLESLKASTTSYLNKYESDIVESLLDYDKILGDLIHEHAINEPRTRGVAIISCIHALSVPVATQYLFSLTDLEVERYLRSIVLAAQASQQVVLSQDLEYAQILLQIISNQGQDFQDFQNLIEGLGFDGLGPLVPLTIIQTALSKSLLQSRLRKEFNSYFDTKRFMSAFRLISWVQFVPDVPKNQEEVAAVLVKHFPASSFLIPWRPNLERIEQWENGNLDDSQRKRLAKYFDLDGPDTITGQQGSLKLVEPECYQHVNVHPQTKEALERFLDLLYKAMKLGPGTLELFIHLCIDNPADDKALSLVDDSIRSRNDSYGHNLLVFIRALMTESSLSRRVLGLTRGLLALDNSLASGHDSFMSPLLTSRLSEVLQAAQEAFCTQIEKGTGEYMGTLIFDLGNAILKASWIHPHLPSEVLARIRLFPPKDVLEAIFDQLEDYSRYSGSADSHFKSYLGSTLGGRTQNEAEVMELTAIREEVQFWKHPPDTLRRDFARTIENIRLTDYSLYTSCLLVILKEDDMFISDLKHLLSLENGQGCLNFGSYLSRRRNHNDLQQDCWLLLLIHLLKEQGSFLLEIVDSMSVGSWIESVDALAHLINPVQSQLPQSGIGLTQDCLSWWDILSRNMETLQFLIRKNGSRLSLRWIYFPESRDHIWNLLDILKVEQSRSPVRGQIVSYLASDGSNIESVCDCLRTVDRASTLGRAVCERMLSRNQYSKKPWSAAGLTTVLEAWKRSQSLSREDRSAVDLIQKLFNYPITLQSNPDGARSAGDLLQSEYLKLLETGKDLETFRLKLRTQRPQQISALLQRIGMQDAKGRRASDVGIPEELMDAIEPFGEAEYELSFPLTGLSDLQRLARGISPDSRLLLVRLCLKKSPRFCIHFAPNDDGQGRHSYWQPTRDTELESGICTTKSTLFTYYLGRNLHQLLQKAEKRGSNVSLKSIYSVVLKLITKSPATCLFCSKSTGIKLWKPATCSKICSIRLEGAPLEVRLHNLLIDPLSMDLLLTCVYAAAAGQQTISLLPGCPVQINMITTVIDSFPPMQSLQTVKDLQEAIRGSDSYGKDRENLISWLCLRFRGFILTATDSLRIPSMPYTQQFVLPNSHYEREKLFSAIPGSQGTSGVVFHGTQISRLFLILTQGLKVMSNTALMVNSAAHGAGIYCGDDQNVSLSYAGSTGKSWANSALGNLRLMLGCELAAYAVSPLGNYHVITDENRLLVRYVFLLPMNYQAPPRHHVEPAMNIAFSSLRSGLQT